MTYRLVATDMDGTLLDASHHAVSPRNRAALGLARAAGARHVVVTGRPVPLVREVLGAFGYDGLAVCGQGSQLYDAGAGVMVQETGLSRAVAREALTRIADRIGPLALCVNRGGADGAMLLDEAFVMPPIPLPGTRRATGDELWAEPVNKVSVQCTGLADDVLAKEVTEAAGDLVDCTVAGAGLVELLPLGMSKAVGLAQAASGFGLSAADTIAFGDMPNDIPMFQWAAYAVAMENAHQDLKALADEVTSPHTEDGVAVVLERLYG
ncbi:HAD family phosphatase [Streptomyces sp. TRM66268-LWL]|uniref:HAD family phosphatase n=1 Tax=Streptomyces polyasparticus TaxID=2767826 RepID=A0ABR7SM03_9ACTN|nr:HAD family hydrolase [Streptomyces polyasparticus]MBC9716389.1 HAD family phosphatase [Streptomyces polyasparticus]